MKTNGKQLFVALFLTFVLRPNIMLAEENPICVVSNLLSVIANDQAWLGACDLDVDEGRLSGGIRMSEPLAKNDRRKCKPKDFKTLFAMGADEPSLLFLLLRRNRDLFVPVVTNRHGKEYSPKPTFAVSDTNKISGYVVVCWQLHKDDPNDAADSGQVMKTAWFEYFHSPGETTVLDLWSSAIDGKRLPFLLGFVKNPKTGYPELPREIKRELLEETEKWKKRFENEGS